MDFLNGKKTYITGAAMMLMGLGLLVKDFMDNKGINQEGIQMLMTGAGFFFLRKGVSAKG